MWHFQPNVLKKVQDEKVRTLKTLIVPNEKDPNRVFLKNGARNGLLLEPLKAFLHAVKNEKYQYIEDNLFDLAA